MFAPDLDRARLSLALEAAAMGTWTWEMAAGRTEWDQRLEELHGLPPGGFGGTFEDWVEALHPDDREVCLARVQEALANPGPYVLLHRTTWLDGSVHWIECRGRVTVDADGGPTGTVGVAHDVTSRVERELAVAQELVETHDEVEQLQRTLLPTRLPPVDGLDVAARYEGARSTVVGGDWYAVVPLAGGRLGLGIGDVGGHGLPAVKAMASARFSARAFALAEGDPSCVLGRLADVFELFEPDTFMTALYGVIDPAALSWTFANAGHCPPVRRSAGGAVSVIATEPQPPIGLRDGYIAAKVQLERGDTLVLYTDGLIERRDEPVTSSIRRLCAAVEDGPELAADLVEYLVARLVDVESNDDDVAVLIVRIT